MDEADRVELARMARPDEPAGAWLWETNGRGGVVVRKLGPDGRPGPDFVAGDVVAVLRELAADAGRAAAAPDARTGEPAPAVIPHPAAIRHRLAVMRTDARLLARLLRLAEDRLLSLPPPAPEAAAQTPGVAGG